MESAGDSMLEDDTAVQNMQSIELEDSAVVDNSSLVVAVEVDNKGEEHYLWWRKVNCYFIISDFYNYHDSVVVVCKQVDLVGDNVLANKINVITIALYHLLSKHVPETDSSCNHLHIKGKIIKYFYGMLLFPACHISLGCVLKSLI